MMGQTFDLEQALKLVNHITHPVTVVAVALVIAAYAFFACLRSKKPKLATVLALSIAALGVSPLAASTYLESRGLYRVRVVVLGPGQSPNQDALVSSSVGGEPKRVVDGWEFDIPPQTRPADHKMILFASEKSEFLSGSSTVILGNDYYPTTTIQLAADSSATVRGVVIDEQRRPVADATVSVSGYSDIVETDKMGNFALPAHAAEGQMVEIRAKKDRLIAKMSVPAGHMPVELILRQQP